jgi:aminoglycoside 6'-N-acetyltransferase
MQFDFRLVTKEDFPLLTIWLNTPHVKKWWREPTETLDEVEKKYGGRVIGDEPTDVYFAMLRGTPIGMIQSYRVDDYPEHAESINLENAIGVDLFIGEEAYTGKGYGPLLLAQFIDKVIRTSYRDAAFVVADPEIANTVSIRAFEKAGFTKGDIVSGEHGPEQLVIFTL